LPGYKPVPANEGIFAASVQPVLEAGLAEVVGECHEISPSLRTEPAYGHTLGHSVVHLDSSGAEAWFTGDVFHHPIELIHPEIDANTCEDFQATFATRNRLISAFIATGALIIPAHFAAPHVGRLREIGGKRVFQPFTP
jgi:glyoxylase-like metal-dependent hydrolase (beta-lactamase superfamily II)